MKYQEQFERVKRWYERFKAINDGIPHERATPYYQDDVYAFFINCYHLKDWIKNDHTVSPKKDVEKFLKEPDNFCLRLCADICNGVKHLEFSQKHPPRTRKKPEFGTSSLKFYLGGERRSTHKRSI